MSNTAKDILIPSKPGVLRIASLYVGQGDCTLLVVPNGINYDFVLVDTNKDEGARGIDIERLLDDLIDDSLDYFINTHPHSDHLKGIQAIHESVSISEVWHSGHIPGKGDRASYDEMQSVIKDIGTDNEYFLYGSNQENKIRIDKNSDGIIRKIGDADYIVISPAEYVADDIDDESADARRDRIHERCGVIKFSYGTPVPSHFLITGDSDKKAWQDHITEYHKDKLSSEVLRSSHHGSRTFFKKDKDDTDVYEDHIENISPTWVIVSAPKQNESKHDHPHDDAMALYKKHLADKDNLLHLGKNRECVIVDINSDGSCDLRTDKELVKQYGFGEKSSGSSSSGPFIGASTTRLDRKPSGSN